jgi:hypothetical protein
MAETVFIKSKFAKISRKLSREDSTSLWGGKSVPKDQVHYDYEYSDCLVDGDQLSIDVNEAIEDLTSKGLKVISITPIISGRYEMRIAILGPESGGYGFSYTEGMLIAAI